MKIGVPKEVKIHEYRVGLVPAGVHELVGAGHEVWVETGAGAGIGFGDAAYEAAGARIADSARAVFRDAELVVKVKEPQLAECRQLSGGQTLFTYLHLAADRAQTEALLASKATCIAYETVTATDGSLPLLTPMSEVAGRMSVQVGAHCLQKAHGGSGVLLGGVPGVAPARVVILGGGVSGTHAAEMAVGLRAEVTVVDRSVKRLRELSALFGNRLTTVYSTAATIAALVREADLVVGAVLIAGAAAPKLVTHSMVRSMKPGSVLVDIAIDQGGCFETSRPCRAHVRARRRHPLLRDQHAGGGAAYLDLRAHQRHPALRAIARRSGLAQRPGRGPWTCTGTQRPRRRIDACGGRRRSRHGIRGLRRRVGTASHGAISAVEHAAWACLRPVN